MATGDQIHALADAALKGDREMVLSICRMLIASERPESTLRRRLEQALARNHSVVCEFIPQDIRGLLLQVTPTHAVDQVQLQQSVADALAAFLEEREFSGHLRDIGLPVPNRILLSGPPGNGKTTLAGAIAHALDLPFLVLDFSSVISSHLGETGAKLAKLFRGVANKSCVLFIDEMETLLVERARASQGDVGEIARVVSSLLLEIDRMSDQVILIGATNHEEMLDRAVVRRFNHHWELPSPTDEIRQRWLDEFAARHPHIPIGEFAFETEGMSLSDLERETVAHCRRWAVQHAKKQMAIKAA